MKTVILRRALACGAALCALSTGGVALAQTSAATTASAAAADTAAAGNGDNNGGAIIVTAERRKENLQNVPVSVGVLSGDDMKTFATNGADTLLSLSGKVPGLYVESSTGRIFPRFYIRGLGNVDYYLGASQPVEVIQDDIVMEHVVLKSNPVFDVAQTEVLRGPQGSLFGRNTTAGIVKFDTVQPSKTWQGDINASWGTFNSVNVEGGVGGPLTKDGSISFRLSGLYQHRDNWIDNTYTGVSDDGTVGGKNVMGGFNERDARLQVLFDEGPLQVRVSGHVRDYDGTSTPFYRGSIIKGTNSVPDSFSRGEIALDEGMNNPQAARTQGFSVKADYDLGFATLTSITGYEHAHEWSRGDTDGGAAAYYNNVGYGESQGKLRSLNQWSQEVRLASPTNQPLRWQVGGMYFDSRDYTEFDQRAYFLTSDAFGTAPNPNNWVLLHNVNTSWGVFGQVAYDVTDRLTLTGGFRESQDIRHTTLLKANNVASGTGTFAVPDVRLSSTKPSFDATALYKLDPDVSLYARIARGFRGPTIQGRSAVFGSPFTTANSETNTSYEAGVKTTFMGGRAHFNFDGFYYVVKDIQLNGSDENGNTVLFNANKAQGYGIEAALDMSPVEGLTFNAGLSLLHTEIDDKNVYAQVCALSGQMVCTVENPVTQVGSNYFAQIDGNPLPNAPKWNLNFSARYEHPVGPGTAFISTDWNAQGYTSFVPYKSVEFSSKGNFEGGLRVGYDYQNWEFSVWSRNITNEKNLLGVLDNYMAGVYNDPRTIGASISFKY
ncbi:TonB-dependent receptor [Novosphingobium sp. 9]|uniref:TonB-dependent receptor n=1 Tax=Novosphingobium sp. 9 TaxID=2025349 RepID=UPI0021B6327A|nr:TonB-dependent receptor [Novosphingobium sp. 9]